MGSFVPNYTARYAVRYKSAGREHTVKFRYGECSGLPSPEFVSGVSAFLSAARPRLASDFTIVGADYIPKDGNFSLPAPVPLLTGGPSAWEWTMGDSPRFWSLTARSMTGQPATFLLFGAWNDPGDNAETVAQTYRVYADQVPDIASMVLKLQAIPGLTATDGSELIIKPYANVAYHSHFQRKARRG